MTDLIVKTASERLKKALQEKFEPVVDTRVAARMGTGLVAIRGQFVPGAIDADAAAVVNVGRPSAAQYSAANGGTVIIGSSSGGGGGSTGVGGATSFSGLSGTIADTQAPQFLKIDGSRMLIGNMDVGAGVQIDGVDISAHAADPNAHHAKQHGIVDPDHHTVTGNQYDIIGLSATNALSVLPTTTDGKTNHNRVLRSGSSGELQLTTLTTDFITAPGNLKLDPTGGVIFDVTQTLNSIGFNGDTFPIGGWSIYETAIAGQSGLTIGYIKADELHVKVFVADETRVDRGEVYISKSYGIISADFVTPSSIGGTVKVYFENSAAISGAIFSDNDWLVVRVVDRSGGGLNVSSIWFQASSHADESATFPLDPNQQSWTLTLRQGATSYDVKKGNIAIDFGASGQGIIQETVIDASGSPYIKLFTWAGANPYSPANYTTHAKLGKLINADDSTGSMLPTGWGLYTDNAYLNGDFITAGGLVRMYRGDGINIQADILEAGDNTMRLQWWADVESRGGSPITSMVAYEQQIGTQPDSDWTEIITNPIGAVGANVYLQANDLGGGTYASVRISGKSTYNASSEIVLVADEVTLGGTDVYVGGTFHTGAIVNGTASTYDIGTVGNPYRTIYVDTVIAGTVGATVPLTGQTWQYDAGDMFIKSDANATRTLYVSNPYSGQVMHLDVDGNITLAGTVDGIDIAAHAANVNAHHAQSHILATTTTLGGDHTVSGLTAGMVLKATSGTDAKFVQLQFTELGGTSSDILSQYVHISIARTITAIHTFSPGSATAPFTLASNAQGQTITGLKADQLNRTITAGNGLSGGGALTADRTITLGTPTTLTVTTTNSVSGTTHEHAITTSNNPGSNARILASTSAGALTLQTLALAGTGAVLTSTAGTVSMADNSNSVHKLGMVWIGDMSYGSTFAGFAHRSMASAGNYGLMQSNIGDTYVNAASTKSIYQRIDNADVTQISVDNLNPAGSVLKDLGDYNRKWRSLYASELYVETLVAQSVMATIGGRIMVAPTTKLISDINGYQNTIELEDNSIQNGDYLLLETAPAGIPQREIMRVVSVPATITGGYRYSVIRNVSGAAIATTIASMTTSQTTIDLTTNTFANNQYMYLRNSAYGAPFPPVEVMRFTSGPTTIAGGYRYSVSRNINVTGAYAWASGSSSQRTDYYTWLTGDAAVSIGGGSGVQGTVIATMTTSQTTIDTTASGLVVGNSYYLQTRDKYEYFLVTAGPTAIAGGYRYTITRNASFTSATAYTWSIGDSIMSYALQTGSGYIDLTSTTTVQNHLGPTMAVYTRTDGISANGVKAVTAMGNLRSFVDYTANTFGWAVGNDLTLTPTSGFVGMTADPTSGLRLFNVVQKMHSAGTEFLRMDTTNGISIMSYLQTVSGAVSPAAINGITFYRDAIAGNKAGYLASVYDTGNSATYGNTTYLTAYDSTVGPSHMRIISFGETTGEDALIAAIGGKSSLSKKSSVAIAASSATVTGDYASLSITPTESGITYGSSGLMLGPRQYASLAGSLRSEIVNDLFSYQALMLLGNTSAGGDRRVTIYDRLTINGGSVFSMQLNVNGGVFLANLSTPGTPSGGGYLYANAGKLFWKGSSGTNTQLAVA